jgi:hypothetical protein
MILLEQVQTRLDQPITSPSGGTKDGKDDNPVKGVGKKERSERLHLHLSINSNLLKKSHETDEVQLFKCDLGHTGKVWSIV